MYKLTVADLDRVSGIKKCVNSSGSMRGFSIRERFWAKVKVSGAGDCWLWMAFCDPDGYGKLQDGRHAVRANRVSWLIHFGDLSDSLLILHSCDNPPCVNPGHLFSGTSGDNAYDRNSKKRQAHGERNGFSKLTEEQVQAIRRLYIPGKIKQSELAEQFNVTQTCVSGIVRGFSWRSLWVVD